MKVTATGDLPDLAPHSLSEEEEEETPRVRSPDWVTNPVLGRFYHSSYGQRVLQELMGEGYTIAVTPRDCHCLRSIPVQCVITTDDNSPNYNCIICANCMIACQNCGKLVRTMHHVVRRTDTDVVQYNSCEECKNDPDGKDNDFPLEKWSPGW